MVASKGVAVSEARLTAVWRETQLTSGLDSVDQWAQARQKARERAASVGHWMVASKGMTALDARLKAARLETRLTLRHQARQKAREGAASVAHLMVASTGVAVSEGSRVWRTVGGSAAAVRHWQAPWCLSRVRLSGSWEGRR